MEEGDNGGGGGNREALDRACQRNAQLVRRDGLDFLRDASALGAKDVNYFLRRLEIEQGLFGRRCQHAYLENRNSKNNNSNSKLVEG